MKSTISHFLSFIRKNSKIILVILAALVIIIIFQANNADKPIDNVDKKDQIVKQIETLELGQESWLTTHGTVTKSSIITLFAQTNGIVESLDVFEGGYVDSGSRILRVSSTYSGINAAEIQKNLAYVGYQMAMDTYQDQVEVLSLQRDLANESEENANQSREITTNSIDGTRSLIDQNDNIVSTLETNLKALQETNIGGVNDSAILGLQQAISGQRAGILQLRAQLDSSSLQLDDSASATLIGLQNELARKQLDIQERALESSLQSARLQLALANVAYELTAPISPVSGVVERIFVSENNVVTPGMPLAVIASDDRNSTVTVQISSVLHPYIDAFQKSELNINGELVLMAPNYVSSVPTDSKHHSMVFEIEGAALIPNDRIVIRLPISTRQTKTILVPLDVVHQSQDETVIYIVEDSVAISQTVTLGNILGGFAEVLDGIDETDTLILTRNVVTGDSVTTK